MDTYSTPSFPMNFPTPPERLYGILGSPLAQSLSPALHSWAFARLGHAGAYFAWEKGAHELGDFFKAVRCLPISGLSVTVPHKVAVIAHLDALTDRAGRVGAANTVFWREGALVGDNTDVEGFLYPLLRSERPLPQSALVLGAGGVCRAVLAGLRELGLRHVTVAARDPAKASALVRDYDCRLIPWEEREAFLLSLDAALLINATPLGMKGHGREQSPLPESALRALAAKHGGHPPFVACDVVYNPRLTRFLRESAVHGLATVDGLDFFAAQAGAQLRLWTGESPEHKMLREAVSSLLDLRDSTGPEQAPCLPEDRHTG